MNKTSNFFVSNILFDLFSTQNNHQLKFLVHQNGENAKLKWSLFCQNEATLFFRFSFVNINVLE